MASLGKGHTDEAVDVSAATRQLRRKLRWRGHLKERAWCRKTGTNLLWWAAAGDDLDAVKGIIAATSPRALHEFLSAGVAQDWPSLMVLKGGQALHQAMAYAHWPVASAVLDAGADHLAVLGGPRMDGLMVACSAGRPDNVQGWLNRFPEWDLERKEKLVGNTALCMAVLCGRGKIEISMEIVEMLLARGASPLHRNDAGTTLLIEAATNADVSAEMMRRLLKLPGRPDLVNYRLGPRTAKWKLLNFIARVFGRQSATSGPRRILAELRRTHRAPALHFAARRSQCVHVLEVLIEAGADVETRNSNGHNVHDALREMYGGVVPPALQQRIKGAKGAS